MSLSFEKISDNDLALAIDIEDGTIIYYHEDEEEEDERELPSLTEIEEEKVNEILDDYNRWVKYRKPQLEHYKKIKREIEENVNKCVEIRGVNLFPLPLNCEFETQIQHLHCTGQQGVGKSYFTAQYIGLYHEKYPDNDIYMFSMKNSDEAYDDFKFLLRIKLDEDFLNAEINLEDVHDALMIFDDI